MAPAPAWPAEAPRARFASSFPPPAEARPAEAWWKRALHAIAGLDEGGGAGESALVRPFGLATAGDVVVVADPDARAVKRVEWTTGASRELACAAWPWVSPMAAAAAPDGGWLVADGAGAVVWLDARGGCRVLGEKRLERPTGVAFAGGRVYVVDPPRHQVVALAPDGAEALRFGGRGESGGQLNFPTAIAAAPDGTLLVVDTLNFRIVRFSQGGEPLGSFGKAGDEVGSFGRPKGLAVDAAGRIFVSDAQWDVVLVFEASGKFAFALGDSGAQPGGLQMPAGLAVAGGRLLVADPGNRRVNAYELLGDAS